MQPEPGVIVAGRYTLDHCIATGGMGAVWVATHRELDSQVAIKFMGREKVDDDDFRDRFRREARAAAELRSPHVVQLLDYGTDDDTPFIVMELLQGEDLRRRLRRVGRLSLGDAAQILHQICKALSLAAQRDIVHRDLKPANIFIAQIGDEEIVKVLDFGVAKDHRLFVGPGTESGVLLGSPHYMSPEQTRGTRHIDHRSDLWSAAVILYQMVTGVRPFEGDVLGDLIIKVYSDPIPPPSAHVPELPPAVDAFFERALCRDPDGRFQSARALSAAFATIAGRGADLAASPSLAGAMLSSGEHAAPLSSPSVTPAPMRDTSRAESARSLVAAILSRGQGLANKRWQWHALLAVEIAAILVALFVAVGRQSEMADTTQAAPPPPASFEGPIPLPDPSASASARLHASPGPP